MSAITKLLIANRGEIACRIIRTCRTMGIATVAIFSEADTNSPHVTQANEAVLIGPPPSAQSYLRGDVIIATALKHGCNAIHPGYGFLSENADFAEAVLAAGLIWVGPSPAAMRAMGSKTAGRASAIAAGIPVAPAMEIENLELKIEKENGGDDAHSPLSILNSKFLSEYPLLVKAVAGGGGRGMRLVNAPSELLAAIASAQREAQNAFGDGRVFLEKFIVNPHHVEIQVFGDTHGNVLHLFERECSIQRRHQKIIEESPSPLLDADLRARMGAAAVQLAKSVGYANAGTMEFLVDAERQFYFLEMNTRLQVEHPVTEMVTGLDLVQLQLQVAIGEALPPALFEMSVFGHAPRGHAIECRICAEDPANQFMPSIGTLTRVVEPALARIETGIRSGGEVTVHYDSMISKLIVHGNTRSEAIRKLGAALDGYVIEGVTTNIAFLRDVIHHPAFVAGDTTTQFIDTHFAEWRPQAIKNRQWTMNNEARSSNSSFSILNSQSSSPWQAKNRFRIGIPQSIIPNPQSQPPNSPAPKRKSTTTPTSGLLEAPMPGLIRQVTVVVGEAVKRGTTLVLMEAMKMELRVNAPRDGHVRKVNCSVGQVVDKGQVLVELE
ncbi:MAG: hypothetical protein KGS46_06865 [Chloroflexi bacterium]|jgi:acetyl/propionyl-CoA carboxylase alpha subunit|nr:hypothetical protein [Chloroflexota bacterium]